MYAVRMEKSKLKDYFIWIGGMNMNSNFRNYNGYIIKRTTIHTVNGACLPNYEIYKEEDVCFKNRLMCEEKLKDAKKWIDKQIN